MSAQLQLAQIERFFEYASKRQAIQLARVNGEPSPWTEDPILQEFRFCNVYREDDRVTTWFRENIRNPLIDDPDILFATAVFRWFNRISTAERIIEESMSTGDPLEGFRPQGKYTAIIDTALRGVSPITTAAYIIKTPNGMKKLEGLLWCFRQLTSNAYRWHKDDPEGWTVGIEETAMHCIDQGGYVALEDMWRWLTNFPFLGGFMAYEIVTDLRHTALLCNAPDIRSWANAGPGAIRGLNRIAGRELGKGLPQTLACSEMRQLLQLAPEFGWSDWEMREVEHTLCEFDKYERARLGEGRPKQRFGG